MELIVDGVIYQFQKYGGISRLYTEILPRMCESDPGLDATLLTYPNSQSDHLPRHDRIIQREIPDISRYIRPYRLWRPYYSTIQKNVTRAMLGNTRKKTWLSTYYTTPIAWTGNQVCVAHDFIHEKYRSVFWNNDLKNADAIIQKKVAAIDNADLVICNSEITRCDLMEMYHIPQARTEVVHLAYSEKFHVLENRNETLNEKFILYVGNRGKYKNFEFLLKAYAGWLGKNETKLVCAGGGDWTEHEKSIIADINLSEFVTLFPQIDDIELCKLYNQASVFIYPSLYEGFGIPLLESIACGCPVIASNIPSSIEVAANVPIYFSSANEDELIAALDQAMNEGRLSTRTAEGLALAQQYSWENTAKGFLQALHKVE